MFNSQGARRPPQREQPRPFIPIHPLPPFRSSCPFSNRCKRRSRFADRHGARESTFINLPLLHVQFTRAPRPPQREQPRPFIPIHPLPPFRSSCPFSNRFKRRSRFADR